MYTYFYMMTYKKLPCSYEELIEYYQNFNNISIERSAFTTLQNKKPSVPSGDSIQGFQWFDTGKKFLD